MIHAILDFLLDPAGYFLGHRSIHIYPAVRTRLSSFRPSQGSRRMASKDGGATLDFLTTNGLRLRTDGWQRNKESRLELEQRESGGPATTTRHLQRWIHSSVSIEEDTMVDHIPPETQLPIELERSECAVGLSWIADLEAGGML
ncbi:hypothetical protein PM082_009737 [Marasmius tenuissimus]|nr:hypothetical protein PM082_009737 [Marasmius tenuissimus]